MQRIVDDLLDAIAARGPDAIVDLVASFAFPLPFTVICELLGVPERPTQPLRHALVGLLAPTPDAEEYARAKDASDAVVALLAQLVEEKRRTPDDALVSALINARDGDDRLNEQELLSTIFQLIIAGHDTTSSLIGNGVVALLTQPGPARAAARRPRADRRRRRRVHSLRRTRPALDVPVRARADRASAA